MSNSLAKTKRRINSVTSTKKITKAMGMVATVKLKRYRDLFDLNHRYADKLEELMQLVAYRNKEGENSKYSLPNTTASGDLYIIITSNLGLCGAYNNDIYRYVNEIIKPGDAIAPLGTKGATHYSRVEPIGVTVLKDFESFGLDINDTDFQKLVLQIQNDFFEAKYNHVFVVYTQYYNSMKFIPNKVQLLPIEMQGKANPSEAYCPAIFEPAPAEMIDLLAGQYFSSLLHLLLAESQLSEQSSRRIAMDNANDNADEIIDKLTIEYNKARQGAITQEITEVVSGANAQN